MSKVAVVILNYNGQLLLEKFLPGIIANSKGHQVIVVDNCSTDNSLTFLSSHYPSIRTIQHKENYGYSAGYHFALSQIDAEYFVLLNSDIEVTENWIEPIIEFMDTNINVAACQPKILSFRNKDEFEYAGGAGGYIDFFGYPFCKGRIFEHIEKDEGQYDTISPIFWASGACLFIRASAYKASGGLDIDFFAHMEEIDLCWRLKAMGFDLFYHFQSTIYHVGGGTLPKSNPFKTFLNFRNSLYCLYKNSSLLQLSWKIPIRWAMDIAAILRFVFIGNISDAWAIIRAHFAFIFQLYTLERKRKEIKPLIKKSKFAEMYRGSLVLAYFLQKRRKFNDFDI